MELVEIAPGIEIEKDILPYIDFEPIIKNVKIMDSRIFQNQIMGIKKQLLDLSLEECIVLHDEEQTLFINFAGYQISNLQQIKDIQSIVQKKLNEKTKVYAVVNYDHFTIDSDLVNSYSQMVKKLSDENYKQATRYTTSTFLRKKLGNALQQRQVAPHIYESKEEALQVLAKWKDSF